MDEYYIMYGTGAGDEVFNGSLEDAMKIAEEGTSYTQNSVAICVKDENEESGYKTVAILPWYGVEPSEDDEVVVQFGDLGYYGAWEVIE